MNQSTASSLRKLAVGAALALGATALLGSSTACSVTVSCPDVECDGVCCAAGEICDANGFCASASCQPDNAACTFNSDCCGNFCASDGFCGPGGSCLADGSGCAVDSDCCTGVCSQGDLTCGCVADLSTGCAQDADCCLSTDQCINGVCQ